LVQSHTRSIVNYLALCQYDGVLLDLHGELSLPDHALDSTAGDLLDFELVEQIQELWARPDSVLVKDKWYMGAAFPL
jgi:hypothetical protein